MKTNALLKLHQRQVDILDMIIKAQNNRNSFERDGKIFRQKSDSHWYGNHLEHLGAMVTRYQAIKNRLIRYYLDVQKRIEAMQPLTPTEADLKIQEHIS